MGRFPSSTVLSSEPARRFARDAERPRHSLGAAGSPEHAEADHGEGTNKKRSDSCDGEPARQDPIGIS